MKFSDLLSALMDVAVELLGAVCRECFQSFMRSLFGLRPLVNVPLATNTLTCDLWKRAMEEMQQDKSNEPDLYSVCFTLCVSGKERDGKRQKTNKNKEGKSVRLVGFFYSSDVL